MLTRLGDKWKDPWWFLWEGCEKGVKCKPLRKRRREYKKRTVFSDVTLQLQLNPSSTALGIEESDCCKEVAVVPSAKNVAVRREVAVCRSSTVISETPTFNPYAFPLFLDVAFLAFAISIFVTFLMFSAFAHWKVNTKTYSIGQSVKRKHCWMKNYWGRALLRPGKLVAPSSPYIHFFEELFESIGLKLNTKHFVFSDQFINSHNLFSW